MKNGKQLERYFKGASNHNRIEILRIINKHDEINLEDIAEILGGNIKTTSEHTRRLVHAGLINKKYKSHYVSHSLSPYGKRFLEFINSF